MSHTEYSAQFVQYSSVFLGLEEALITSDRLQPTIHLQRLPLDVRELYEKLRPHIHEAKLRFKPEITGH
jgi:hypothetical protein